MPAVPVPHEANAPVLLTRQARRVLEAEARRRRDRVVPELGALRHDADHDSRLDEDDHRATRQPAALSAMLERAEPVELLPGRPPPGRARRAVTVRLEDGTLGRYLIVHPAEVTVGGVGVSVASPLGAALVGRSVGEAVDVHAPGGTYRCEIVGTDRRPDPPDDATAPAATGEAPAEPLPDGLTAVVSPSRPVGPAGRWGAGRGAGR